MLPSEHDFCIFTPTSLHEKIFSVPSLSAVVIFAVVVKPLPPVGILWLSLLDQGIKARIDRFVNFHCSGFTITGARSREAGVKEGRPRSFNCQAFIFHAP